MSIFNFPNQRIPESKKDEEWHKNHILNYLKYTGTAEFNHVKAEMAELYYAAAAKLSPKQEKIVCATITEKYGENFGPQYYVYPLIESNIEQMVGDYRNRPLKRKCLVNNEKAVIKKLDTKVTMLTEQIVRELNQELEQEIGFVPESEKPEMEIPDNVEEFFQKDYRTISEEVGEDILYQTLVVKKDKEKIYDALRHYLTGGHVWAMTVERDGHPSIFIPHPLEVTTDIDIHESVQKDIQFFCWDRFMSINQIFNLFDLSEEQKKIVEAYAGVGNQDESFHSRHADMHWFEREGSLLRPRVIFMKWISRIDKKFLYFKNKQGKEEAKLLPDNYQKRKDRDEDIRTVSCEDVRFITMLGPDLVLDFGREKDQLQTVGNKKKRYLDVVGLADYRTGTGEIRSLAKKLYYLQDFASEILYELRLNMRQLDGNVLVYDVANMPKEFLKLGIDKAFQRVNFYLKRDRMQIINSKDKKANTYANSTNVSQKGRLQELMNVLALIEDLASKMTGISKEAQAQAGQYQKATVAEMNLTASASRVENYFGLFDSFVETFLERLMVKAKFIYQENDTFTYFGGDLQTKFLKIYPDFLFEDLGIHIGDNRLEYQRKQRIDSVAQQTFANAQSPEMLLELIKIWNSENSTEAEAILSKGVKALAEIREENMKLQQQQMQIQGQTEQQKDQLDYQKHQEQLTNNIDVANIYADNKIQEVVAKEDGANKRKAAELVANLQKDREKQSKNNSNK